MSSLWSRYTQAFPPRPKFVEENIDDLHGKVYVVTGSNTGVGKQVARMLYSKNANVYMAARSQAKADGAIKEIKALAPSSTGSLTFLALDLNDLSTIKSSASYFLAREKRLDVLFNNAGVMSIANLTRTAQGHETNMGVNCLGTFLFTELLTPVLAQTAKTAPAGTVRVVWVSSSAAEFYGVKNSGVDLSDLDCKAEKPGMARYGQSKAGNYLHAVEYARRHKAEGIVSIPLNPGNLDSGLWQEHGTVARFVIKSMLYPVVYGAYTLIYAGLSPGLDTEKSDSWIIPWGRLYPIRKDLIQATKTSDVGGSGAGLEFWKWSETQIRPFL